MLSMLRCLSGAGLGLALAASLAFGAIPLDEKPAGPGEWGYRPAHETASEVNPPAFVWRPMKDLRWELQVASDPGFSRLIYSASGLEWNVHCPSRVLAPGAYHWRYRGHGDAGTTSWSRGRAFSIPEAAPEMPLPPRAELLARIPREHPRLFTRPEHLPRLRELAAGDLRADYDRMLAECEEILADPPDVSEPPKYPPDVQRKDERWREIWWGNRLRVVNSLGKAAVLGFAWRLSGKEAYGAEAKRILLAFTEWDPRGSTGIRYNDEAGMPAAYYLARTYTFIYPLLSEEERAACRRVARVRGADIYAHLLSRPQLWRPYESHANRLWHFLGELGIAFHGEVRGADDWVWFAVNVFYHCYPVWSDADGGWHEGYAYWISYQERFTWWADVMREALGLDAFRKPYYSQVGFYAMYLMPPGKLGGGFGDLCANKKAADSRRLMSVLAAQAGNPYWQWYVEALGGPRRADDYVGFIRGALPPVEAKPPGDLPTSRLFLGTGQAMLNTTLENARDDVQVVFKSSPFGTQSHGYAANNSFLLFAYGQRLLIESGYRDIYGSDHHANWMWSTRSVNNITINGGQGQIKHSAAARGEITAFTTTPELDLVEGEAGAAHPGLARFTRTLLFAKPDLVVVYDRLVAEEPATFEYWLHAVNRFQGDDPRQVRVENEGVACDISFLYPSGLQLAQTNQYDPNPRERVKLREWHLTASTPEKRKEMQFITLYRPHRVVATDLDRTPPKAALERVEGGYLLRAALEGGELTALLPMVHEAWLRAGELETSGGIVKARLLRNGRTTSVAADGVSR